MGGRNMYRVMRALEGVEILVPCEQKGGKKKKDLLQAHEMMFLLAIARRQPDETPDFPESDTICYGDQATMQRVAHVSHGSVYNLRDRLRDAGLIRYWDDGYFRDFNNPSGPPVHRKYVYQLNWPTILSYSRHSTDMTVKSAGTAVHPVNSALQPVDSAVPPVDSTVHPMDTKKKEINENLLTNSSSKKSPETSDSAVADKSYIKSLGLLCLSHITFAARLTSSESSQIKPYSLGLNVIGKDAKAVLNSIDASIKNNNDVRKTDFPRWIRFLVGALKRVPKSATPSTREDFSQAFGVRRKARLAELRRLENPNAGESIEILELYWADFCYMMGFEQLETAQQRELLQLYKKASYKNLAYPDWVVNKFEKDFPYNYKEDATTTYADIRQELSLDARYDLAKRTLEEMLANH